MPLIIKKSIDYFAPPFYSSETVSVTFCHFDYSKDVLERRNHEKGNHFLDIGIDKSI